MQKGEANNYYVHLMASKTGIGADAAAKTTEAEVTVASGAVGTFAVYVYGVEISA